MIRVNNFSSLADDDSSLGNQSFCRGPGSLHEVFPAVWVQKTSGVGGADGFSRTAMGEEFEDGELQGAISVCEVGGFDAKCSFRSDALQYRKPTSGAKPRGILTNLRPD